MFHWNMYPFGFTFGGFQMMADWFIVFLVLNTAGIAEIIYLLATNGFDELKKDAKKI